MTFIKLDQADLDSPCREISNGGLKIAVALLVRWKNFFFVGSDLTFNPAVVDVSPLLLILLATADGSSSLSCGSESINNFFIRDYHLSFCSENTFFYPT